MRSATLPFAALLVGCFEPAAAVPASTESETTHDASVTVPSDTAHFDSEPDMQTDTETAESTGGDTGSTSESMQTEEGPIVECDGADGERDPSCPDDAPFCIEGACRGCAAAPADACAAADPDAPACDESGACVPCSEHAQCESGACRIDDGRCFAIANTLHVDNQAECAAADGSAGAPLCTIGEALEIVASQPGTEGWIVRVAGSTQPYAETIDDPTDRPLAVVGPTDGLAAAVQGTGAWTVSANVELYLARLQLSGATDVVRVGSGAVWIDDAEVSGGERGLGVDGGRVTVRRTSFRDNGTAIDVPAEGQVVIRDADITFNLGAMRVAGEAELDRVTIADNYVDGGIWVGGTLRVRNSFLYDNLYMRGAIEVDSGASVEVVYTTIVDAFTCPPGSAVTIRNSIAVGGLACDASITTSAVEYGFEEHGTGNVGLGDDQLADVFVFPDPYEPDYHLLPDAPILDVARWRTGDPAIDVDGDARPTIDGTPDVPGADVPAD